MGRRTEEPMFCPFRSQGSPRLEGLEGRLLLDGASPAFVTQLASPLSLANTSLTIGLEASDDDIIDNAGDLLTYSVVSDAPGVTAEIISSDNQFAALHFLAADGETDIGMIIVQLFEDRCPTATQRFITLATCGINDDGTIDDDTTPFYHDVVVHRVIPDFMFQTGDALNGDGTGGSPLGAFPDDFDPDLRFTGPGVLACANSGLDTNDSQFFITAADTTWLDGDYFIFGQMVSAGFNPETGETTYDTIINTPTEENPAGENSSPIDPPLLAGVDILTAEDLAGRYGVLLVKADDGFTGKATVTVTVTDQDGNEKSQDTSLVVPKTGPVHAVSGVETNYYLDLSEVSVPEVSSIDGVICSVDPQTWQVTVQAPSGYNGAFYVALSDDGAAVSSMLVISQEADTPALLGIIPPYSDTSVLCTAQAGNLLYAGLSVGVESDGGIIIFDITDPSEPVGLSFLAYSQWDGQQFSQPFNSVTDIKLVGSKLYVLDTSFEDGSQGRLTCVDVSDPTDPVPIGSIQTAEIPYSLAISGNRAFVADFNFGLTSYDISDPAQFKKYNHAFTALPNGMEIAQISDVAVRGQYAYLSATLSTTSGQNYGALVVVNVANPANMTYAGSIGTYMPLGADIEGNLLFVTEWLETQNPSSRLSAYDLNSPTAPKYLGSVAIPENAWQLDVVGDKAVVVPRTGTSVTLLDVGDPRHMHVNYTFANDTIEQGTDPKGYKPFQLGDLATVPIQDTGTLIFDLAGLTDPLWVDSKTTFLDDHGTAVTISIRGGGSVKVTTTDGSGHVESIEVFDSGSTTRVTITTPKGLTTAADEIVIHGSAGSFTAGTTHLTGDMTVSGSLATLTLGNADGGVINLHSDSSLTLPTTLASSITLGAVSDLQINTHGMAVKSLKVLQWLDNDGDATNDKITAPRLDKLTVMGDFEAGLSILGKAGVKSLGSVAIGGGAGGTWNITGDVGKVAIRGQADGLRVAATGNIAGLSLGAAKDSNFLAGFTTSFTNSHPDTAADFPLSLLASIGSIKITGLPTSGRLLVPRFVDNSNFSAARIGAVQLRNVDMTDCGLYALAGGATSGIRSVRVTDSEPFWKLDPAHNWSWRPGSALTPDIIHLL